MKPECEMATPRFDDMKSGMDQAKSEVGKFKSGVGKTKSGAPALALEKFFLKQRFDFE